MEVKRLQGRLGRDTEGGLHSPHTKRKLSFPLLFHLDVYLEINLELSFGKSRLKLKGRRRQREVR